MSAFDERRTYDMADDSSLPAMTTTERTLTDWERIEAKYRAGVLSVREIATQHGITEGAVRKRAKRNVWERDLKPKVDAKVRTALVRTTVRTAQAPGAVRTENEIVNEAAATVVEVVRQHRRLVQERLELSELLYEQLLAAVRLRDAIADDIKEATAGDKDPSRCNRMMKAIGLPTHIVALKDLALATKTLISMERQAFGLSDGEDAAPPVASERKARDEENARLDNLASILRRRLEQEPIDE